MKKRIFCLAFVLAVALMTTPALAVNCGNVESAPAAAVDYSVSAEEMPLEEPTVDWDTAAAFRNYTVVTCGDYPCVEEPIVGSVVDLNRAQQDKLTFTVDGQVMVPLRLVAENMGYAVEWNEETQSATVNGDGLTYTVRIGEDNVVDNATGNVISYADYDVLDIADEDVQADTAAVFDYDMTVEKGIPDKLGDGVDGSSYSAYEVITFDGEKCGTGEIQSVDGNTYKVKYDTENAEADGGEMVYTITTNASPKAELVNGMTYVPASMFSVMNYSYDAAENCFTLKIK